MEKIPVIAIFDIGKTNKKLLLFDEDYKPVFEESIQLKEKVDEDGFPCEDIFALTDWVKKSFARVQNDHRFEIKALNFSAYGASFVYLDENKDLLCPLYNYLKPFPHALQKKFYAKYGGESRFSKITASPVLGNLNSGMQLYRLKIENPAFFNRIKYALHLPQYLSFIFTSALYTDITSIGCHTNLWNFHDHEYHEWVGKEGLTEKFPPRLSSDKIAGTINEQIPVGGGLHDSSSALIPYFISFQEPFVLLSTGTWSITLNPFNNTMLSDNELDEDCLCYLSYKGKPVKASRLFAGYEHAQQVKRLAEYFNTPIDHYLTIDCDGHLLDMLKKHKPIKQITNNRESVFRFRNLDDFSSYDEAYHQLMIDIIEQQVKSTNLVLKGSHVKKIFVDGGFSANPIFMFLLATAFPGLKVYAASVAQASALGAALAIHQHWNRKALAKGFIDLNIYPINKNSTGARNRRKIL